VARCFPVTSVYPYKSVNLVLPKYMQGKNSDSKYVVLWLCVGVAAIIIIAGWIIALKYNFNKMNAEMTAKSQTLEQAENEVKEMFSGIEAILKKNEEALKTAPVVETAPEKDSANEEVKK